MPLKLVPPKAGRRPNYQIRGTYLGVYIDRTAGSPEKTVAKAELAKLKGEIERGSIAQRGEPTFAAAALAYLDAGGEARFLERLNDWFGDRRLSEIDQQALDAAAIGLYPDASPATRNRQVYSPMSAIMKRAGIRIPFARPKGSRGQSRLAWLRPEEAWRLLSAAENVHSRFGALCTFLLYTGCRLSEALSLRPADLHLGEAFAYVRQTKNGDPRAVHLPPVVVAAMANIELDPERAVFRLSKGGYLYGLFNDANFMAEIEIPDGIAFHIFRHSYGAWMRRYAKLDTSALLAIRAWKSRASVAVYEHVVTSEEARKADLLPVRATK